VCLINNVLMKATSRCLLLSSLESKEGFRHLTRRGCVTHLCQIPMLKRVEALVNVSYVSFYYASHGGVV
jgi:hypothetical protein